MEETGGRRGALRRRASRLLACFFIGARRVVTSPNVLVGKLHVVLRSSTTAKRGPVGAAKLDFIDAAAIITCA